MKKSIALIAIVGLAILMLLPPIPSYAGGHHGGSGLYAAGALLGGVLLGTVIGSAISQPRYVAAAPAPAYVYPEPAPAYACPSPGPAYAYASPPGEWVVVPGRWVNGTWVPPHRVWAPVNPY